MAVDDHLLHRQVNPDWVQNGEFSSQTFRPTLKDGGKLSVYDGNQSSASNSFMHYTTIQKLNSAGVVSVSTGEVAEAGLHYELDGVPFPEHGYIDFNGLSGNQVKAKAILLKAKATARGWSYQP